MFYRSIPVLQRVCFRGRASDPAFLRLSDEGMRCGDEGLSIGGVPLLQRSPRPDGGVAWTPRPSEEVDRDLGDLYGLPIDSASKRGGLSCVARGLESGDLALAQIAAVQMRFPDPPSLAKDGSGRGSLELALQLLDSGLIKADWDPAKHPRTGEPPNPGWFAPTDGEYVSEDELKPILVSESEPPKKPKPKPPAPRQEVQSLLDSVRSGLKDTAKRIVEAEQWALWATWRVAADLKENIVLLELAGELLWTEARALNWAKTSDDPPKSLEELLTSPTENMSGYERHHIVEQNDDNIVKSPLEIWIEKFGSAAIEDSNNVVWIPRLKHELITAYYNSREKGDTRRRLHREVVNAMDFVAQREAGLEALRRFGVLK